MLSLFIIFIIEKDFASVDLHVPVVIWLALTSLTMTDSIFGLHIEILQAREPTSLVMTIIVGSSRDRSSLKTIHLSFCGAVATFLHRVTIGTF
jgi:hypothetical protein